MSVTSADVQRRARMALILRARPGKPAKFDGDKDGFRTGPSGKDNIPYTAAAKRLAAKAGGGAEGGKAPAKKAAAKKAAPSKAMTDRRRLADSLAREYSEQAESLRYADPDSPDERRSARLALVAEKLREPGITSAGLRREATRLRELAKTDRDNADQLRGTADEMTKAADRLAGRTPAGVPAKKATPAKATKATPPRASALDAQDDVSDEFKAELSERRRRSDAAYAVAAPVTAERFRAMSRDERLAKMREVAEAANYETLDLSGARGWARHVLDGLTVDELREMVDELADIGNWGTSEKRDRRTLAQAIQNLTGLNPDGKVDTANGRVSFNDLRARAAKAAKATPARPARADAVAAMVRENFAARESPERIDRAAEAVARLSVPQLRQLFEDMNVQLPKLRGRTPNRQDLEWALFSDVIGFARRQQGEGGTASALDEIALRADAARENPVAPKAPSVPRPRGADRRQEGLNGLIEASRQPGDAGQPARDVLARMEREGTIRREGGTWVLTDAPPAKKATPAKAAKATPAKAAPRAGREPRRASDLNAGDRVIWEPNDGTEPVRGTVVKAPSGTFVEWDSGRRERVSSRTTLVEQRIRRESPAGAVAAAPAKKATPRSATRPTAPEGMVRKPFPESATTPAARVAHLRSINTREQAQDAIADLTRTELLDIARELSVPGTGRLTIDQLRNEIVEGTVGRRLTSIDIRGFTGDRPGGPGETADEFYERTRREAGLPPGRGRGPGASPTQALREAGQVRGSGGRGGAGAAPSGTADRIAASRAADSAGLVGDERAAFLEWAREHPGGSIAQWRARRERPAGTPTVESLRAMSTRDEVHEALAKLNKTQLVALASEIGISGIGSRNMEQLRAEIVQATVGRRIDSLAIRGFEGDRP